METVEEVMKLGDPDPEQTALLEKMGPLPEYDWNDMPTIRQAAKDRYQAVLTALGPAAPSCTESYIEIPLRDGTTARTQVWTPATPAAGGSPLVVLFFGGGFVMGNPEQLTMYGRDLARQFGATVLAPTYRLAPEHKWPTAPHDAWDTVVWAGTHAAELGADPAKGFVIGGISAGANLSAVVGTQYMEEGHTPALTGLWLSVPSIFSDPALVPEEYREFYQARKQNADAPILSEATLKEMASRYAADPKSPLYSPGARTTAIPKMPPVYFQVCGMDPLRDDAIIYDKMLRAAGRKTLVHLYPGLVHAGWGFFPSLKLSQQAKVDFCIGLGWLLDMKPREDAQAGPGWAAAGG